ncbi:MAG: hypothetical protein RLY97_576 [Pseudomonadota bacterium]|jgi:flagellar hook protein FlgE
MSFYTSLNGLKNAQVELDVISHNIANSDTNGFKRSVTAFADIVATSVLTDPALTTGIGARVQAITQQFSQGPIAQTGNSLDMTVNGEGFFVTKSPDSNTVTYTRNGSFSIDGTGFVRDNSGYRMQIFPVDASGNVTSTASTSMIDAQINQLNAAGAQFSGVNVASDGKVVAAYSDGSTATIGVVALVNFLAPQTLRQLGSAHWAATGVSGSGVLGVPSTNQVGSLLSGALEQSNVDLASELVGLISAQRSFQANAKAIDTATQISQTLINLRTN